MLSHWPPNNAFLYTLKLYAEKGANENGFISDSTEYFLGYNYCMHVEKDTFTAEIQPYDMTILKHISVASGMDSTYNNLHEVVREMSQSDIDVLIISSRIGISYPSLVGDPTYLKDIICFMKDFKVYYPIKPFQNNVSKLNNHNSNIL